MPAYGHYNPNVSLNAVTSAILKATQVTVRLPGTTTLASIYLSRTGGAKANPFTTHATTGNFDFWTKPGDYDLLINGVTERITVPPDRSAEAGRVYHLAEYADPTGVTDSGPALRALVAEIAAAGGLATVVARGFYRIDGNVLFPNGIALAGEGPYNTVFTFRNGGKFSFGDQATDSRYPPVGGFTITAGDSSITEAMYVGCGAANFFHDIRIDGSLPGIGLNVCGLQNSTFENIDIAITVQTGIVVDLGSANLTFVGCHASGTAAGTCFIVRQSGPSSPLIGVAQPSKIHWVGGIIEGNAEVAALVSAGFLVNFFGATLNGAPTATGVGLKVAPQTGLIIGVEASGSQIRAAGGIGVDASGLSIVTLSNRTEIRDVATGLRHDDSTEIRTDGTVDVRVGTGTKIIGTGSLRPAGSAIWVAGQRTVVLSADQTITSNTTFADLGPFWHLVGAGELLRIEFVLLVDGDTAAPLTYRWRESVASTVSGRWRAAVPSSSGTTAYSPPDLTWRTDFTAWATGGLIGAGTMIEHRITADVTASQAMNLFLQAKKALAGTNVVIRAGSRMTVTRRAA